MNTDPLAVLDWMIGRWTVAGRVDGQEVHGAAVVRRAVEGSVLEAREQMVRLDGTLDYEDMALYLWDAAALGIYALHISAPGAIARYAVLPLDGRPGVHWMAADLSARVVLTPDGEGWRSEVWQGTAETPISALRYSPPEDSSPEDSSPGSSSSMSRNQPPS